MTCLYLGAQTLQPGSQRRVVGGEHPGLELKIGGQQIPNLTTPSGDDLKDRSREIPEHLLGEHGHHCAALMIHCPRIGLDLTAYEFHEGGFAGPVSPHERHPLPGLELEPDSVKQGRTTKGKGTIPNVNQ